MIENPGASFRARVIKLGILTLSMGLIANFLPALFIAVKYGVMPPVSDLAKIWLAAAAAFGVGYVIQPVSFFPMIQTPGSYIVWLCGNVAEIRVPAATMAQKVTNAEQGTPKAEIMATIGIAGSVLVSATMLTLFTFIGAEVIPLLPKSVTKGFTYILPAVFGAVYAELASKNIRLGVGTLIAAVAIVLVAPKLGFPGAFLSLVVILAAILLARAEYKVFLKQ
jgi:hypothetical protein